MERTTCCKTTWLDKPQAHRSSQCRHQPELLNYHSQPSTARWSWIYTLIISSLLVGCSSAWDMEAVDVSNTTYYKELALRNIVVVDKLHSQQLDRRDESMSAVDTSADAAVDTPMGLPVPFDTSLGSNFTSNSCPDYFTKFLSNGTFQACLPVSLLLQNSMSFFQAARSASLLDKTLDTSCSASLALCSPLMTYFADELITAGNCQDDYLRQNPLVMQAYSGLKAYEPVYQATCVKDKTSGKYCFTEAMTSSNNTDDSYPYYTAVGIELPTGSRPTCSACLQHTMQLFSEYAVQKDQPLSQTYLNCAVQVNFGCGQSFANTQVQNVTKVASKNGGSRSSASIPLAMSFVLVGVLSI